MNCSLKSNGHKHSPHDRIYIEIFHFVSRFETVSLSHNRENFPNVWNVGSRFQEIVWPYSANTVVVWVSGRYEFPRTHEVFMENQKFLVLFCLYESPRTLVQLCIFCRTWELDAAASSAASWLGSLATSFPVLFQSCCQGALSVPGLFDEELVAACETKFNVGFDFDTILSSPLSSCILFAIFSWQPIELKFWAQQSKLKWLMLNKWRRLFHSSRVKWPFVSMCASWCLVSTYLIWFFSDPHWFSQTTSQEPLCGFWIHVSLLDFGLWWSF